MARTDYYGIQTPVLQATSQAIRTVNGTVGTIAPEDYPDLIAAMKSGTDYDNVMAQLVEETTTPASIASFTDGANNLPVKEIVCQINPTETGTGAKSPSNPYVIGGHTEINVTQRGVNLWDEEWELGGFAFSGGNLINPTDRIRNKNLIRVSPSTTYYIKAPATTSVGNYDKDGNYLGYSYSVENNTFTTKAKCEYIRFMCMETSYNDNISVNYPSTDTAYHAYNGQTHHADFGQTVYGGELNVTTGVLTITHEIVTYDGSDDEAWRPYGSIFNLAFDEARYNKTELCNRLTAMANGTGSTIENNAVRLTLNRQILFLRNDDLTDVSALKTWLSNNPVTIVFELETSYQTTIQLTPTEVKTMLGANNLYHDCNGNIEVEYRANGALYVAQH